jgi:hypothetical protein
MSIRFYDEAVADKINAWLPKSGNKKIQVLKPEETRKLFTIEADQNNDRPISLPLIALSRDTTIDVLHRTKQPMSFDGIMLDSDSNKTLQLDAIPIGINYQLDIYTRRYDEGDDLLREFLFKLINYPQLVVEFPYNKQHFKHVCSILISGEVEDTSDISERLFSGQFTRWTIRFEISGAYLFSLPIVDNVNIDITKDISLELAQNLEKPYEFEKEEI